MEITDQTGCEFSDTLNIGFHNQPTAEFFIDSAKCKGYNLTVLHQGNTVEPALFSWYSNDTVFASGIDLSTIEIPLGFGQRNRSVGLKIDEKGCNDESFQTIY